jgi:hypothetical protein
VSGHGADAHRAVATQHKRELARGNRVTHPLRGIAHDLDDLRHVLGPRMLAVRAPPPGLSVAVVADIDPTGSERLEQSGLSQCLRRLLLPRREGGGAGRHTDHAHRSAHV